MSKTIQFVPQAGAPSRACLQLPNTNDTDMNISVVSGPSRLSASIINSDGLIELVPASYPRFDYTNGSCPYYLNEPQKTNKIIGSEDFTISAWVKVGAGTVVSPNIIQAPTKVLAYSTRLTVTDASGGIKQVGMFDGPNNSASVFARANNNSTKLILSNSTLDIKVGFDLINGTVLFEEGEMIGKITPVAYGFFRCSIVDFGNTQGDFTIRPYFEQGSSSIYIFGAMMEVGLNITSYIPTTTTQTYTRIQYRNEIDNLTNYMNLKEGTIILKYNTQGYKNYYRTIYFSNGSVLSTESYLSIQQTAQNTIFFTYRNVSPLITNGVGTTIPYEGDINLGIVYANNRIEMYINGELVGSKNQLTTIDYAIPKISFQRPSSASTWGFFASIKEFEYYNTALTPREVISKTE